MVDRERRFNVRMSDEEVAMLQTLAEREGMSASDYVRQFVRRSYAELKAAEKPRRQ